jgi:ubiquinol-cytochrome c reductase cytochrome c subunit
MRLPAAMAIALAVAATPPRAAAQDPSAYYEENCSACHTIGGGAQGGPDLKGVTTRRDRDWLVRFLLNPQALESDPAVVTMIAAADGMAMPAIDGMTRERAEALIAFLSERSAATATAVTGPDQPPFTPEDVAHGRALFNGASRLAAAGPACIACHTTANLAAPGGGRLGPDLTNVHARLGGSRGLSAWLGATPTPMMRAVYRGAGLTPPETRALTAYFETSATTAAPPHPTVLVLLSGLAGAVAVLAGVAFAGRRRFRAVRRPLVARATGQGDPR